MSRKQCIFIVLAIIVLLLVPIHTEGLLWHELSRQAHVILSLVLTLAIDRLLYPGGRTGGSRYFLLAVIIVSGGGIVELLQTRVGREASISDMLMNLAGLVIGLLYLYYRNAAKKRKASGYLALATIFLLSAWLVFPTARLALAYFEKQQAFPVVLSLGHDWSDPFIRLHGAGRGGEAGGKSGGGARDVLRFRAGDSALMEVVEPVADWRGYGGLRFEIYSWQERAVYINLRIHDVHHNQMYNDRYNKPLLLAPGNNTYVIPLDEVRLSPQGREMDMSAIDGVILFMLRPNHDVVIRVSDMVLTGYELSNPAGSAKIR